MDGAEVAKTIRQKLDELKLQIADAKTKVGEADRLGMEVRGPRFDLRKAEMALTNARTQVHSFALEPTNQTFAGRYSSHHGRAAEGRRCPRPVYLSPDLAGGLDGADHAGRGAVDPVHPRTADSRQSIEGCVSLERVNKQHGADPPSGGCCGS